MLAMNILLEAAEGLTVIRIVLIFHGRKGEGEREGRREGRSEERRQ